MIFTVLSFTKKDFLKIVGCKTFFQWKMQRIEGGPPSSGPGQCLRPGPGVLADLRVAGAWTGPQVWSAFSSQRGSRDDAVFKIRQCPADVRELSVGTEEVACGLDA